MARTKRMTRKQKIASGTKKQPSTYELKNRKIKKGENDEKNN